MGFFLLLGATLAVFLLDSISAQQSAAPPSAPPPSPDGLLKSIETALAAGNDVNSRYVPSDHDFDLFPQLETQDTTRGEKDENEDPNLMDDDVEQQLLQYKPHFRRRRLCRFVSGTYYHCYFSGRGIYKTFSCRPFKRRRYICFNKSPRAHATWQQGRLGQPRQLGQSRLLGQPRQLGQSGLLGQLRRFRLRLPQQGTHYRPPPVKRTMLLFWRNLGNLITRIFG